MEMPDGQIFNVISNGGAVMPSYRYQVPVEDRWAIVAYVRALQRSQHASLGDYQDAQRGVQVPSARD
jgi:mono/diheme cytochrome c family protein